ncbi:hypothetical protein [Streptomyces coeruleorubidus]|uniref:hypothetical protein n=1 Tax=Streptomyces coeruleorubidus TaxID=116188 RepID=UPI0033B3463E
MTDSWVPLWPGIPCTFDIWPLSADSHVFEARRAIGQLARDRPKGEGSEATNIRLEPANVLDYISAAQILKQTIDDVMPDLVAQARAEGRTWAEIGSALGGVGKTAAQKRFKEVALSLELEPLPPLTTDDQSLIEHTDAVAHRLQTADDPWTFHLASLAAERIWAHGIQGIALAEVNNFVAEGAEETLDSRIKYLHNRVTGALAHVNKFLVAVDEHEYASAEMLAEVLYKVHGAIDNADDLILDHQAWSALVAWIRKRPRAEEGLFDDPVAYCRQVFFAILMAGWYLRLAKDNACSDTADGDRIRLFFERVRRYLMAALTYMLRDDVLTIFYPDHLPYLRRPKDGT